MADVIFKDNSAQILQAFRSRGGAALNLVGSQATRHTQDRTPVRTGNLVNHAGWEVAGDEKSVLVGFKFDPDPERNPDYAPAVELGGPHNRAQHMLQQGVTNFTDEYKAIVEKAMKGA